MGPFTRPIALPDPHTQIHTCYLAKERALVARAFCDSAIRPSTYPLALPVPPTQIHTCYLTKKRALVARALWNMAVGPSTYPIALPVPPQACSLEVDDHRPEQAPAFRLPQAHCLTGIAWPPDCHRSWQEFPGPSWLL